ncbi:6383_t:CDS:10 [Funneliformis mosseae]|uniref:FACT complex subunit n=1 Tax=Funneliformis mosseae TaxID=27381 RepID=A0A9N9BYY5_FUNMO|nr:6383_t:CDS:10 [Funneliformis mosseae]
MTEGKQLILDTKTFHKRARILQTTWKESLSKDAGDEFQGAETILVIVGDLLEEYPYQKSTAIQTWLLGYEWKDTLILFTQDKIHFVTKEKIAEVLEQLNQGDKQLSIEIHKYTKDQSQNKKIFESILDCIAKGDKKRLGILPKDLKEGHFVQEWQEVYEDLKADIEEVDVSAGIASVLAIKDDDELKTIKAACKLSSLVMQHFIGVVTSIIDEEKQVTHEKLSEDIDNLLISEQNSFLKKGVQDVDLSRAEFCYTPIIQSGGVYDFKSSAESDERVLHDGTILCSFGLRYKSYCSNIGRTILFNPTKEQEKNYEILLELQRRIVDNIKSGVKLRDVYLKAVNFVKSKKSDLVNHFVKSLGHGMGIEFRESAYSINSKNTKEFKHGMVFNLFIGFQNLENPKATDEKGKIYSLWIIDTIRVSNETATLLTEGNRKLDNMAFSFQDGPESDQESKKENKRSAQKVESKRTATRKSTILKSKFRSEDKDEDSEQKRKDHQAELAKQKQAEGLARFGDGIDHQTSQREAVFRKFESYKRDTALPKEVKDLKIVVDQRNESVILPVFGLAVPFHISTLKNVNKTEEGEYTYLRINFLTPGQASGKKEDMPFDDPTANFVRAVTYRSTDENLSEIYRKIVELKKTAAKKEAERKEMSDLVEQDKLIELRGRRPTNRLSDVFVRPGLDGKRIPGELEIHENGLRYQSHRSNQKLDILFSNIQHLFFQPCDNELIVLLHIHLKNPVIHGKKKTQDIQFYREASDVQFDETGNRKRKYRYGDEDELGAEQEERRRRALLNKEFKAFSEKIAEASEGRVDVDIPFREIAFQGVPFRTNVLLQPTTDCLVHLTDPPFLIITIADVEIAHLERVQYGLKNFDLVFIFKDYTRTPVHINTIPMNQLENVKDWLDHVDLVFYEGPQNLNWTQIMRTISKDPADFYKNGGWSFLSMHGEGDDSETSTETASEYVLSESEFSESSSDDDSRVDEEVSEYSEETTDDSGESWDELEEKARKADERKEVPKRKEIFEDTRGTNKKTRR